MVLLAFYFHHTRPSSHNCISGNQRLVACTACSFMVIGFQLPPQMTPLQRCHSICLCKVTGLWGLTIYIPSLHSGWKSQSPLLLNVFEPITSCKSFTQQGMPLTIICELVMPVRMSMIHLWVQAELVKKCNTCFPHQCHIDTF